MKTTQHIKKLPALVLTMSTLKKHLISLCTLVMLSSSVLAQEFHVSPTGDDANPGTKAKPFSSLTRARDAVRKVNEKMDRDIIVHVHGGEYLVKETMALGPKDSGKNGHKIIYAAAAGSKPILTGGIRIVGWELHDSEKNIYSAATPQHVFRQIYIGGKPGIRARTPNHKGNPDLSPVWPCATKKKPVVEISAAHWQACSNVPKGKLREVEMVMLSHWYQQRLRIGKVAKVGEIVQITPLRPEDKFNKDNERLKFYHKNHFWLENALAFVDAPFEWYHDSVAKRLYLALPKGKTPENLRVEIPVTETLINIEGVPEKPVRGIEFLGLTFQCSNWYAPSKEGVNMTQAAQAVKGGGTQPSGMIQAKHVKELAFRNCMIRNAGANGIMLFNADSCDIEGNSFNHIAANGIDIDRGAGRNPAPEKQSVDVAIWNNHATKCGNHYTNGIFLFTENVKGLIVEHNLIHDMPYSGMQIGQQPGKIQDVGCGNNRIRFNHIHHCVQVHGDGGGIYTLGGIQKGSIIAGNYVHDIKQSKYGHYKVDHIYLDNYTSKILIKDNVLPKGRVAERNGSKGNMISNTHRRNPAIEKNAGIKPGYNPKKEIRK